MCWHMECLLLFRGLDIKHAVTSVTHLFSWTLSRKLWWTMVRHRIEQHMFLVENYIGRKNSYQQCVCKYADSIQIHLYPANCMCSCCTKMAWNLVGCQEASTRASADIKTRPELSQKKWFSQLTQETSVSKALMLCKMGMKWVPKGNPVNCYENSNVSYV
jgi:hypothetical protein